MQSKLSLALFGSGVLFFTILSSTQSTGSTAQRSNSDDMNYDLSFPMPETISLKASSNGLPPL
jgi:hypothetical protein